MQDAMHCLAQYRDEAKSRLTLVAKAPIPENKLRKQTNFKRVLAFLDPKLLPINLVIQEKAFVKMISYANYNLFFNYINLFDNFS